jgi:hypothetical protein
VFASTTQERPKELFTQHLWLRTVRVVLTVLVMLIVITPITQSIWMGDNFLHGQDTETTLIVTLTLICASLLQMQHIRSELDRSLNQIKGRLVSLFSLWSLWHLEDPEVASAQRVSVRHKRGRPRKYIGYQFPLLI